MDVSKPAQARLIWFTVPTMALITLTALGVGVSRACCGLQLSSRQQFRIVPIVLAALTSGIALFSYIVPRPDRLFD